MVPEHEHHQSSISIAEWKVQYQTNEMKRSTYMVIVSLKYLYSMNPTNIEYNTKRSTYIGIPSIRYLFQYQIMYQFLWVYSMNQILNIKRNGQPIEIASLKYLFQHLIISQSLWVYSIQQHIEYKTKRSTYIEIASL
jgi:hypothetical protein